MGLNIDNKKASAGRIQQIIEEGIEGGINSCQISFPQHSFGSGEVIGDGDASTIEDGDVLTINGKSCTFSLSGGGVNFSSVDVTTQNNIMIIKTKIKSNGVKHFLFVETSGDLYHFYEGNIEPVDSNVRYENHNGIDFAFDTDGNPCCVYVNTSHECKFAKRSNGSWTSEVVFTNNWDPDDNLYLSLCITSNGNRFIPFLNQAQSILRCARWDGSQWNIETIDNEQWNGWFIDCVSNNNEVYVAYWRHEVHPSGAALKFVKWNGSSWGTPEVVDTNWTYVSPNITFNLEGNPVIAYSTTTPDIRIATYNGSTWSTQIIDSQRNYRDVGLCYTSSRTYFAYKELSSYTIGCWVYNGNSWTEYQSLDGVTITGASIDVQEYDDANDLVYFGYCYNNYNTVKYIKSSIGVSWDNVKTQLDASEIGTCGLFTISRPSAVGEISIYVNDDYTDCVIERDDTGLFSASFSDEHNGKKRGAIITLPTSWDKNKVPIMYGNISSSDYWENIQPNYRYEPSTGKIFYNTSNQNLFEHNPYLLKFNFIIFEGNSFEEE